MKFKTKHIRFVKKSRWGLPRGVDHYFIVSRKGRVWMSAHQIQEYYKAKMEQFKNISCTCLLDFDALVSHQYDSENLFKDPFLSIIVKAKIKHERRQKFVDNSPSKETLNVSQD